MGKKIKVLLIGESWMIHTMETKGFDVFTADHYETGIKYIESVLSTDEIEFNHMPCHRVSYDFPKTLEKLLEYEVILISDIGANTFLLPVETFLQCQTSVNKLVLLKEYVEAGGGLGMIGGYLSFMGIEGKGRYSGTPIEEVLPVNFLPYDDRSEHPEGVSVSIDADSHEIFSGVSSVIKGILGYNKAVVKPGCTVAAAFDDGTPFIALGEFGKGRSITYATDCAPHWSSYELCESDDYKILWQNIVKWLARK